MTDKPINLDEHRGMAAQKATELRRLLAEGAVNEQALQRRQAELEAHWSRRRPQTGSKQLKRRVT